jgi:hypothetical protein
MNDVGARGDTPLAQVRFPPESDRRERLDAPARQDGGVLLLQSAIRGKRSRAQSFALCLVISLAEEPSKGLEYVAARLSRNMR